MAKRTFLEIQKQIQQLQKEADQLRKNIDFDHLQEIDVVEALAQFEMRRAMSKSGVFKAIVPLEAIAT